MKKYLFLHSFAILAGLQSVAKPIEKDGFKLEIPDDMRVLNFVTDDTRKFYANGDGLILPAHDETKSPVQVGITVERFDEIDKGFSEWIDSVTNGYKRDSRLKLIKKGKTILSKDPKLMKGKSFVVLHKGADRKSVHTKYFYLLPSGRAYIVSSWLVGGKDSKMITPNGEWHKALTKMHSSFKPQ